MEKGLYMEQIVLASNSPRRKEILEQVGIAFTVLPSSVDEIMTKTKPWEVVLELSEQKAGDVAATWQKDHPGECDIIIGADTVVAANERILGKPKDSEDARDMLMTLQGNEHSVYTGVSIVILREHHKKIISFYEETRVEVFPMSQQEITRYLACGEYKDKAGAYGIQGRFAAYIKGIHGDYYNVVGFPVARFLQELKAQGIGLNF